LAEERAERITVREHALFMEAQHVSVAGGVPTIWLGILALLDQQPPRFDLRRVRSMIVGGSAAPQAMSATASR
jgi:fatty-acyl-CoA synthase